ncbi:MAG: hypothetical protein AAF581_22880 [Planctomycetota bacterium]
MIQRTALVVLAACLLAGCVSSGSRDPQLRADHGGIIDVETGGPAPLVATHRYQVRLRAVDAGALFFSAAADRSPEDDATTAWQLVSRIDDSSLFRFAAPGEGHYRFVATTGDRPTDEACCLELHVDRTAPRCELSVVADDRDGAGVRVQWRVEDALPLSDGVSLYYSSDGGLRWHRIVGAFAYAGEHRWPHPGAAAQLVVRLDCSDLAGNATRLERSLAAGSNVAQPRTNSNGNVAITPAVASGGGAGERAIAVPASTRWFPGIARVEATTGGELTGGGRYLFAGGARVELPRGAEFVVVRTSNGLTEATQEQQLVPVRGFAHLPRWNGGPFELATTVAGEEIVSPRFWIDSSAPEIADFEVRGTAESLQLRWQLDGQDPEGFPAPTVTLHYRGDDGDEAAQTLVGDGTQDVAVSTGNYRVWIVAQDASGNVSSATDEVRRVTVGRNGPRPLNFSGETFAAAGRHLFFMSPGPPDAVHSVVTVRILATVTETQISAVEAPAGASSLLLETPPTSGDYWVEISWSDRDGRQQVARGEEPFTVDAEPPRIRWQQTPSETSGDALFVIERLGDRTEPVAALELLRRPSPVGGDWHPWPSPVPEPQLAAEKIELRADLSAWMEGDWEIAAVAVDALGNRTAPLAALPVRVDRTPPDPARMRLPAEATEGTLVQIELVGEEAPGVTEAAWFCDGAAHVTRRVSWKERDTGWIGTMQPFPAGKGRLLVTLHDPAGNVAERSAPFVVAAALEQLDVAPGDVVAQGAPLFVSYRLAASVSPDGLEVQIRDGDRIVARQPLLPGKDRVVVAAPAAPGAYSVGIAPVNAALFESQIAALTVRGHRARTEGATTTPDKTTPDGVTPDGATTTAVGTQPQTPPGVPRQLGVQEELRVAQLVSAFRTLQGQWQLGERGAQIEAEKQRLIQELQAQLVRAPRHVALRKALARLLTLAQPPDYRGSLWVLEQGIVLGGHAPDLAALHADAGVIALQSSDFAVAADHLVNAIRYEDGAHRRYNLGLAYRRLGMSLEAEAELRRAVVLAPTQTAIVRAWAKVVSRLAPEQRQQGRAILEGWRKQGILEATQAQEAELILREGGS